MTLDLWAARWKIPVEALQDLKQLIGILHHAPTVSGKQSETANQQQIRLDQAKRGVPLWRNNVGVATSAGGTPVRFGLANDSKAVNEQTKSGDLIGITPHIVQLEDVGRLFGIFTSIEVKRAGWRFTGTPREQAQLNWALLIISKGGKAQFASSPEEIR